GSSSSILARSASVAVLSVCRKPASASAVISSLPTEDSISSSEDLIDSSGGGSEVSAHAALSSAAPEAKNALVMAQRTNCRPIAIQVRLIVMSASPPGGECRCPAAAGSGYAFALRAAPIPRRAAGARSALIPSRPASKTLSGHENHDRPDRQLRQLHVQPVPLSGRTRGGCRGLPERQGRSRSGHCDGAGGYRAIARSAHTERRRHLPRAHRQGGPDNPSVGRLSRPPGDRTGFRRWRGARSGAGAR